MSVYCCFITSILIYKICYSLILLKMDAPASSSTTPTPTPTSVTTPAPPVEEYSPEPILFVGLIISIILILIAVIGHLASE